jgi:hypothetical protein
MWVESRQSASGEMQAASLIPPPIVSIPFGLIMLRLIVTIPVTVSSEILGEHDASLDFVGGDRSYHPDL